MASRSPSNVNVTRDKNDPNTVIVSWQRLTLIEARGFIVYVVELRVAGTTKRQASLMKEVSMNMNSTNFTNVDRSTNYQAVIGTRTPELNMVGPSKEGHSLGKLS